MTASISLHALLYGADAATLDRLRSVLLRLFPQSLFKLHDDAGSAVQALKASPYDLVVLSLGSPSEAQSELLAALRSHENPMPVCIFLAEDAQDDFTAHEVELDPDWEVHMLAGAGDFLLRRAVLSAIGRHELKWERDHLQRAFRSSISQYRSLFDEVPDIIFLCDRAGSLLDVNATAARVFDVPKQQMMLRPVSEAFGIHEDIVREMIEAAGERPETIEDVEVAFRPPSGKVVHGLMHIMLWQQQASRPPQYQGVIKDITRRKTLEHQLRESESRYRSLYELAQVSSGSLQLETVARQSLELIMDRCHAKGGALLLNRSSDRLELVAAVGGAEAGLRESQRGKAVPIGQEVLGRWAISQGLQSLQQSDFDQLSPDFRHWLHEMKADLLWGFPLGRGNLTLPAALLLVPFRRREGQKEPDSDLFQGLARTLEMGITNCFHHAQAREAEKKYRDLWENAPAYFFSLLKGGIILEVNQTASQALGFRLQEMIGQPFETLIETGDRTRFAAMHKQVVERGANKSYELRLRKRGGGAIVASMTSEPLLGSDGSIIGEKAVLYDITRDKELEEQLRDYSRNLEREVDQRTQELTRTTNFLTGILEGATEYGIFGLDRQGRFVHLNRGAQLLFRHDAEELIGRRTLAHVLMDGDDGDDLSALLEAAEREDVLVRELPIRTGDGNSITAHLTMNRLEREAEGSLAYVCIARDVTKEKEMEQLLKVYTENLEQLIDEKTAELDQKHIELIQSSKLATLGEMATGIAHELNQPLSGIRMRAQLLSKLVQRGKADAEKTLKVQQEIMDLVDRINKIIHHMRTFARQDEQPFAAFEVSESIDACLNLLGEQLRVHGVEVEVEREAELPEVFGEPSQIEQVLLNLVSNARDALNEREKSTHGKAGIEKYRKRLRIEAKRVSEHEICLSVRDNGIGMSEETQKRLFQPFFTTKPVGQGTGLGLSISYGIIAKHQGRIEVESSAERGTAFRIFLPVFDPGQAAMEGMGSVLDQLKESARGE